MEILTNIFVISTLYYALYAITEDGNWIASIVMIAFSFIPKIYILNVITLDAIFILELAVCAGVPTLCICAVYFSLFCMSSNLIKPWWIPLVIICSVLFTVMAYLSNNSEGIMDFMGSVIDKGEVAIPPVLVLVIMILVNYAISRGRK